MPALAERASSVEFVQLDPKGLSDARFRAEVAKGINAIHTCVHAGQKQQEEWNAAADQKRDTLDAKVDQIAGSVRTLTDLFASGPPAVKANMGWKEHLKIAGTIGACLGLFVFLYKLAVAVAPAFHKFMLTVQT